MMGQPFTIRQFGLTFLTKEYIATLTGHYSSLSEAVSMMSIVGSAD